MNLYLLSQDINNEYDTYDSCVVAAKDENSAKKIHPREQSGWNNEYREWVSKKDIKKIKVRCIGKASKDLKEGEVVIASYNAG